jgi:hypothetical protein
MAGDGALGAEMSRTGSGNPCILPPSLGFTPFIPSSVGSVTDPFDIGTTIWVELLCPFYSFSLRLRD